MAKIKDLLSLVTIFIIFVLTALVLLSIWEFIDDKDIISKSLATAGILFGASVVTIIATHFITFDRDSNEMMPESRFVSPSLFTDLRKKSLVSLIVVVVFLAFLGVFAVWDVFAGEVVVKSFASSVTLIFASILVVLITLERDGKMGRIFRNSENNKISIGKILLWGFVIIIFAPIIITFLSGIFWIF